MALAALIGITAWAWPRLPAVIAIHFGANGEPDGWGSRWMLLFLPVVGTAMFAGLLALARVPWTYNYPWAITAENAQRQYVLARRFILALSIVITMILIRLVLGSVAVSLGTATRLGGLAWDLLPLAVLIGAYSLIAWLRR